MAEALLVTWEERVGALKNIRADLWGVGGRLEGCRRARGQDGKGKYWKVDQVSFVWVSGGVGRADGL